MIHTLADKTHGFPITSISYSLDESFTGVVYLRSNGITTKFKFSAASILDTFGVWQGIWLYLYFYFTNEGTRFKLSLLSTTE